MDFLPKSEQIALEASNRAKCKQNRREFDGDTPDSISMNKQIKNVCVFLPKVAQEELAPARERSDPYEPPRLRTTQNVHIEAGTNFDMVFTVEHEHQQQIQTSNSHKTCVCLSKVGLAGAAPAREQRE